MPGHAHSVDRVLEAELARQRSDHRQIHAHRRRRRWPATPPAARSEAPAIGRDHIGIEIANHGRTPELAGQPVPEGAKDRPVLPARTRARGPRGDPLGLAEQVALDERSGDRQRGGERVPADATVPTRETRSASTGSTSSPASTAASMSCGPLTANDYSRNG